MNYKWLMIALMMTSSTYASEVERLRKTINTEQVTKLDIKIENEIKHSFDVDKESDFYTALRFIDMNLEAGVKPKDLKVALVVHGKAIKEILKSTKNENVELLLNSGIAEIIICGQTMTKKNIESSDLKDGVLVALSAMNAHHYLQQKGYSYNPF